EGRYWGPPVLSASLALVEGGRLYYRGRDALVLARESSVEEVAALLWTGDPGRAGSLFAAAPVRGAGSQRPVADGSRLGPVERCQRVLPLAAASALAAYHLPPDAAPAARARGLRLLAAAVAGIPGRNTAEATLQAAWLPRRPPAAAALRAALILCADHELNVSAFTARCVASAAASPYDVVAAGLAALKGARHGGEAARGEALLQEAA